MARLRVWLLALHAVVLNADDTYDVANILYIPNSKATRQSGPGPSLRSTYCRTFFW